MLIDVVTDSSKKGLDSIAAFGKGQDEPVRGGTILSVTLLFPRSDVKNFACLRSV